MRLDEYQKRTSNTAIYPPDEKLEYLTLGLTSEAGEVAGIVKKWIRDGGHLDHVAMAGELGDVLWYVSELASAIDASLGWLAAVNLKKLDSRRQRGKIGGSGDDR